MDKRAVINMEQYKEQRKKLCRKGFEVNVMRSNAGWYIGTYDEDGPNCRLSQDYYKTEEIAQNALDKRTFTERDCVENNYCSENKRCF